LTPPELELPFRRVLNSPVIQAVTIAQRGFSMAIDAVWRPGTLEPGGLLRRLGGSLAHHVNNALTGVVGHLELALPHTDPGSAAELHLRASLACAHQAAESVRRVVGFACRGPTAEEFEEVRPQALLADIGDRLGPWVPGG